MRIKIQANLWVTIAAINGFVAVFCRAMVSHYLNNTITEDAMALFNTAAEFQMSHSLALFFTGLLLSNTTEDNMNMVHLSGISFSLGILMFSGSLYWLSLMGSGSLGAFHFLTPLGGVAFLAGWALLAIPNFKTLWPKK